MPAAPAVIAGRYRLGRSLGTGGMGQVWLARDETLDREVAVKEIILPPELIAADRDDARERTLREARAAARLSHPNVVQVFDMFEDDDRTWIVMEYVPSRSLQQVISQDGPLEPRRAAEVGLQVLAALRAAHLAGVTHRDIKPANVLLAPNDRVVLTDFGIATIEGDGLITRSGLVLGSTAYMSPERVRHGIAGPAADLWSLGATLFTAVEGRSPFQRPSEMETLTAVAADEPDPAKRAGPLAPVLEGLLRKDPEQRIDMDEAEQRLRTAASEAPPTRRWWPKRNQPTAAAPAGAAASPSAPSAESAASPSVPSALSADAAASPSVASPAAPASPSVASPEAPASPSVASPDAAVAPSAPAVRPETSAPVREESPAVPVGRAAVTGEAAARRRWPMLAAAAVLLVLVIGAAVWLVVRQGRDTPVVSAPPPATATAPAASAPPSAAASPSSPPSRSSPPSSAPSRAPSSPAAAAGPKLPVKPAGWKDYTDKTGFSVYVPVGWTRSQDDSMVYFRDPKGGRTLGIDQTKTPAPDPVKDWEGKAEYRVGRGDFPGYDEIKIDKVDYFQNAADWEYTFDGGNRRHVNNRGVITSKHQAYGIYWQTSDKEWKAARADLQLIFDSFRPAK